MKNRIETAIVRVNVKQSFAHMVRTVGAKRRGTVYHPVRGHIVGFNFGTSVRPDVAPIAVTSTGDETIASFLARGGQITTVAPKVAKGAVLVNTIKSGTTRVAVSRG